jgi:hypothetical protein
MALALAGLWLACWVPAGAAAPVPAPVIRGSIQGELKPSSRLTIRLTASEGGGFQTLHQLQVFLLLHGVILDEITYEQETNTISTASSFPIPAGNPNSSVGPFLRISGRDVSVTGSGDALTVVLRPTLTVAVPPGAVFNIGVIDDLNQVRRVTRVVQLPTQKGGFSWGDLALAALAALFIGGFVGNLFASRRRPAPKPSIYSAIQRRMERESAPK